MPIFSRGAAGAAKQSVTGGVDNNSRIDALTGLRIFAAAAVFLSHTAGTPQTPPRLLVFMAAGYNGVTVFFTLSGFVLAWAYADRLVPISGAGLRSFFVARLARIYPLYLFALAIAVVPYITTGTLTNTIWLDIFPVQAWSPSVTDAYAYNGPGWSIGVEFFLYACFPLILVLLVRVRRRTLLFVLALAVVGMFVLTLAFVLSGGGSLSPIDPNSAHRWLYRMPLTRLGDFTVGIVGGLLIRRSSSPPAWAAYSAQGLGLLLFLLLMSDPQLLDTAWSWDVAYLIPSILVIWGLAAGPRSVLARFLATRPFVLLGEASFAFYILHGPLLNDLHLPAPPTTHLWLLNTATEFAIILLVGIGAHVAIERPAQRWLRKALDRRPKALLADDLERLDEPVGSGSFAAKSAHSAE